MAISLVVLTAAVMKADGRVTRMELGHVREFFASQFGPAHSAELLRLLRDVLQRDIPLREVCEQVRVNMPHPMRLQLMHYLIGFGEFRRAGGPCRRGYAVADRRLHRCK